MANEINKHSYFDPQSTKIEFCLFQELESTHDFSLQKNWFQRMEENHLIVVIAAKQTRGIGSHNRSWFSPHNDFHINLVFLSEKILPFSQLAAITACQHLKTFTKEKYNFRLKWPNDIYISDQKIGGCLTYIRPWNKLSWVTIGVGINFNLDKEDTEKIDQPVTSLKILLKKNSSFPFSDIYVETQNFASIFTKNLHWYHRIGAKQFIKDCNDFWLYFNQNVVIFDEDKKVWVEGIFENVTENGCLVLRTLDTNESIQVTNGTKLRLSSKQPDNYKNFIENFL